MAFASEEKTSKKYIPGSDALPDEIFDFPFLKDVETCEFIKSYHRIMFIIRGPPGTAKSTLSKLIKKQYDSSAFCSADSYFDNFCVNKVRNRESLAASHTYCAKRVTEECEIGSHPIIVQNTHMKIFEVKPYIDIANEFGYTIVMAITIRKLEVSPEILAKTNRKGLRQDYFKNRLAQWQEYHPSYLGWFLSMDDSSYMLNEGKKVLASVLGDGRFCNTFRVFKEDEIWKHFKARKYLSCIATYCKRNSGNNSFYLSDTVQSCYGKCFSITICGYVITKSYFLAVVNIPSDGQCLVKQNKIKIKKNNLYEAFDRMGLDDSSDPVQFISFSEKIESDKKTAVVTEWEDYNKLNIKKLSIMMLGQRDIHANLTNIGEFLSDVFGDMANDKAEIDISEYAELDDGTEYYRLPNSTWFIRAAQKITIPALFTGCYL